MTDKFNANVHFPKKYFFDPIHDVIGGRGWKRRQILNSTTEWTKNVKFVTWTHVWTTNSIMMFILQKNNYCDPIDNVIGGQGKKGTTSVACLRRSGLNSNFH